MQLQLVVKIVEFLLDVRRTRTVLAHAERQQHVDLKYKNVKSVTCVNIDLNMVRSHCRIHEQKENQPE